MGFLSYFTHETSGTQTEEQNPISLTRRRSAMYDFGTEGFRVSLYYALIVILIIEGLDLIKNQPLKLLTLENIIVVGAVISGVTLFSLGLGAWATFLDNKYPDYCQNNLPRKIFSYLPWSVSLFAHYYKGPTHILGLDKFDKTLCGRDSAEDKSRFGCRKYGSMKFASQPVLPYLEMQDSNSEPEPISRANSAPVLYHGYPSCIRALSGEIESVADASVANHSNGYPIDNSDTTFAPLGYKPVIREKSDDNLAWRL